FRFLVRNFMSRERETWDKINRQKKVSVRRETPTGPSPVGDFLKRLSNKHKLAHQEQEAKRLREIEILAEMEWRQFTLPSFVKEQLREFEIDEVPLVKAVQATLTSRPIAARSSPVKFWMYCR